MTSFILLVKINAVDIVKGSFTYYAISIRGKGLIYVVYHYSRAKRVSTEGGKFFDKWYTTYIKGGDPKCLRLITRGWAVD